MTTQKTTHPKQDSHTVARRRFLTGAGASLAAFSIIKPQWAHTAAANQTIKLGILGCGGRGVWISRLFAQHGGYQIAAAADYFQDRVDGLGDLFDIPASNRFTGLAGYKRLIDKGIVDAVAVETPPFFHPEQAAAGVAAGLHVYVAKPI
ncbi:MAG: Gfo/Idh/MocA family oxidoreductase, partial [Candidatus Omnitrophica bacterium]|nr:Gfo/Idh/MocA family oxidoreductase [Candidatus Omnitrophota bacterium]